MPSYDYQCVVCDPDGLNLIEVKHSMHDSPQVFCACGRQMRKLITTFPHVAMNWHDPLRANYGSDRMVIRSAERGKPGGALSDGSDTLAGNLGLLD